MNSPLLPTITPLQERAITRFEYDRDFYLRVYAAARSLEPTSLAAREDLAARLREAMTTLQEADELVLSDEALVRGARALGDILALPYERAAVPEKEGLKTGVRRIMTAVEGPGA